MGEEIYLDFNATCPVDHEVANGISETLRSLWGNPSSSYRYGKDAKIACENSRSQVAKLLNCTEKEIIFTSGGTEANNWVIRSAIDFWKMNCNEVIPEILPQILPHIVTSTIEHDSVRLPLLALEKAKAAEISWIPVSPITGALSVDEVLKAIKPNTCLITIMLANNETGVIQPIAEIVNSIRNFKITVPIHTDAAQCIGKIKINLRELNVDFLTIVGHKFYGPRIGALYAKDAKILPMYFGGGQERNLRPGTENTPMIVGLGIAAELASKYQPTWETHMLQLREYFEDCLRTELDASINFDDRRRLPNTCSVCFKSIPFSAAELLQKLPNIFASTGAACHSTGKSGSYVLRACGVPDDWNVRTVRFSLGKSTTKDELDRVIDSLKTVIC